MNYFKKISQHAFCKILELFHKIASAFSNLQLLRNIGGKLTTSSVSKTEYILMCLYILFAYTAYRLLHQVMHDVYISMS